MKIAFLTTQSEGQSTVIGRVFPLASYFQKNGHTVTVLLHKGEKDTEQKQSFTIRKFGKNPFSASSEGKKRARGLSLFLIMATNAMQAASILVRNRPDILILVKPLPENVLAVILYKTISWNVRIVADIDDFELFANATSSLVQRSAIHISERLACMLAYKIVVATPFLHDHFQQLTAGKKPIQMIPTGLSGMYGAPANNHVLLYIGSISISSGHRVDLLPDILRHVREYIDDATLIVAGSGHDEEQLRKSFEQQGLGSHVEWVGRFSEESVPDLISRASVIVDPIDMSINNRAKSSFRVALAALVGMPVVTSNVGIRPMLIPASLHAKCFANPEDSVSYANHIRAFLETPLVQEDQQEMQLVAKSHTWEVLAGTYMQYIV